VVLGIGEPLGGDLVELGASINAFSASEAPGGMSEGGRGAAAAGSPGAAGPEPWCPRRRQPGAGRRRIRRQAARWPWGPGRRARGLSAGPAPGRARRTGRGDQSASGRISGAGNPRVAGRGWRRDGQQDEKSGEPADGIVHVDSFRGAASGFLGGEPRKTGGKIARDAAGYKGGTRLRLTGPPGKRQDGRGAFHEAQANRGDAAGLRGFRGFGI
jgi:hypothetical protein